MPYKKKKFARKRGKRAARTGAPLSGAPRLTRALRVHQNLTRDCRWFKTVTQVRTVPLSNHQFRSSITPSDVIECNDFQSWGRCWEQFKVLQYKVRYLPVAVGAESLLAVPLPAGVPVPVFLRGNTVSWLDQGEADITPNTIGDIIVRPSAKLIASRRPHMRWASRPKGHPEWGTLDQDGAVVQPDSWDDTRIKLYGQGFSDPIPPATQLVWFYVMIYFKVLFRARQQTTPSPLPIP